MSDELFFRDAYEGGYDHGDVLRAEIREGVGKHQIGIFDYPIPSARSRPLAPELTPMAFRWGTSPVNVRTFYGYVNHHELWVSDVNEDMYLRFFCVGTAAPLNNPHPAAWRKTTASHIARKVAERHGLRAVVRKSRHVLPYWTSAHDTDFEMLNRLAEDEGYHFWVDGATLHFVDPQVLLTSPGRAVTTGYSMNSDTNDTLFAVHTIDGAPAPTGKAPYVQRVFGIDAAMNNFIRASSTKQSADKGLKAPPNSKVYRQAVRSLAEAQRRNDAASVAGSWASVTAFTVGDARPRVGSLVNLDGDSLASNYHGTWLATDLIHVISPDETNALFGYECEIGLTRNQKGLVYHESTATIRDALTEVPATLRNNMWHASAQESVYVV